MSKYHVLWGVAIAAMGWGATAKESSAAPPLLHELQSQVSLATLLQDEKGSEAGKATAKETRRLQLDDGDETLSEALKMLAVGDAEDEGAESDDDQLKSQFGDRVTNMNGSHFTEIL